LTLTFDSLVDILKYRWDSVSAKNVAERVVSEAGLDGKESYSATDVKKIQASLALLNRAEGVVQMLEQFIFQRPAPTPTPSSIFNKTYFDQESKTPPSESDKE